jgi:putative membrane protein
MTFLLAAGLALSILVGIFALQNALPITVTFLFWQFDGSLALILLGTFSLGVFVSLLVSAPAVIKRRIALSHQSKRIAELERSVSRSPASHKPMTRDDPSDTA